MAEDNEGSAVTPVLHQFVSAAARKDLGQTLKGVTSWHELGCDDVATLNVNWLRSPIQRVCYARATGRDLPLVFSIFYTAHWQAAHFDYEAY
jgi:hypothetical protein